MQPPALAPEVRAALPTFFVIGASKAGTTSLHEYLAVHPEIAMTRNKEPMCFEPPHWVDRMAEYRELFPHLAEVRGESSTAYSAYPWVPEIPDRVRATVPDARIIYIVRDPIQRTISHYAQNVWDQLPVRPFDDLMDDLEHPMNMPVWASRYATQYERWAERFGAERILVLDHRKLLTDRAGTMRQVFAFLEVDPYFTSPAWDAEHNTAVSHRVPTDFAKRLGRTGVAGLRVPALRRLLTREVAKPQLTAQQRERLVALLRAEADRLRGMTGLALDHWSL